MGSFDQYGIDKIPNKILLSPFAVVIIVLLSIPLKLAGIIDSVGPSLLMGFGIVGLFFSGIGLYTIKEAILIRKSFVLAKAKVLDNTMSIAGHCIKLSLIHESKQYTATVVRKGYIKKGTILKVLYDPTKPTNAYIYGLRFYLIASIPLIIGCMFSVLTINIILKH